VRHAGVDAHHPAVGWCRHLAVAAGFARCDGGDLHSVGGEAHERGRGNSLPEAGAHPDAERALGVPRCQ